MTSPAATEAGPEFFAIGFGVYAHYPHLDVDTEIERVARQFEALGVHRGSTWTQAMAERDWPAVEQRLESWVNSGAAGSILYWVGHGISNQLLSGLAHATSPDDVEDDKNLVTPANLARAIQRRDADVQNRDHWTLVLIDACQSARFIEQVNVLLDNKGGPRRVLLLASSPPNAVATLGRLSTAVEAALRTFIKVPEVPLVRLAQEIKVKLEPIGTWFPKQVDQVVLHNVRALPASLRTTLDHARDLVGVIEGLPPAQRAVLRDQLSLSEFGDAAWNFTGRADELTALGDWLASDRPLLVVTGAPGSGKSAILGNLLLRANPVVWTALRPVLGEDGGPDLTGGPGIDAALRLTGADARSLIGALTGHLQLGPAAGTEVEEQTQWLVDALAARPAPVVVVADGLDEAADVFGVAGLFSRLTAAGVARFVVGTRRSINSEWGVAEPERADILERLGADAAGSPVLTVERDPDALAAYVTRRLEAAAKAGIGGLRARIPRAAEQLRDGSDFLFARLAVLELMARPSLVDGTWLADARQDGPAAIFRQALRRLDEINPRFRPLLVALADRRGRGMPSELKVWLAAAQGAAAADQSVPSAADLDELLSDAGAPYVLVDAEFDTTAYRLAHRVFADELLREPQP